MLPFRAIVDLYQDSSHVSPWGLDCWDKHPVANIVVKPRIFGLLVQNSDVSDSIIIISSSCKKQRYLRLTELFPIGTI